LRLLLVVAILAIWEIVVRVAGIPAFILPAPSSVAVALWRGTTSICPVRANSK
jgi:NitT/TauT family transport system permease protein